MTAQSPRPTLERAFSVLIVALLVGSVVAPIAATGPAAAAQEDDGGYIDGSFEGTCDSKLRFAFPVSCPNAEFAESDIDESQAASAIETDIHVSAQTVEQNWESQDVVYQNYLQDTETLASLEARNAIADAYENGSSAIEAQAAGQAAINDYYAAHEKNLWQMQSQHTARLMYLQDVASQHSDIDNGLVHIWPPGIISGHDGSVDSYSVSNTTYTATLQNGSTHTVTAPELTIDTSVGTTGEYQITDVVYDHWVSSENRFEYMYESGMTGGTTTYWDGGIGVMNVDAAGLEAFTAYDYREFMQRMDQLESQAQTVQNNYDSAAAAEDLYAAMDSGELDPNEVRGAEGMVRYMSGDGNVTEDRFNLALRSTLDLAGADLDSTMVVNFEGATERERIASEDGSVSYEYNSVNETYEGLLFSSETPADGFQKGETYDVSNLEGTTTMVTDGGASETTFYRGNLTITNIYDSDDNEVESVEWRDPEYDSYNASAFVAALEEASQQREQIVSEDDGNSGSDVTISNPFDDIRAGGAVVGLVVIAGAIGVVVVVIRP